MTKMKTRSMAVSRAAVTVLLSLLPGAALCVAAPKVITLSRTSVDGP